MFTLLAVVGTAWPGTGLYHAEGSLAESEAQEAIFRLGDGWSEVEYLVEYDGDAVDFGWVIPIPDTFVHLEDADRQEFVRLRDCTQPAVVYEAPEGSSSGGGCALGCGSKGDAANFKSARGGSRIPGWPWLLKVLPVLTTTQYSRRHGRSGRQVDVSRHHGVRALRCPRCARGSTWKAPSGLRSRAGPRPRWATWRAQGTIPLMLSLTIASGHWLGTSQKFRIVRATWCADQQFITRFETLGSSSAQTIDPDFALDGGADELTTTITVQEFGGWDTAALVMLPTLGLLWGFRRYRTIG